jgi:mono/diheme cytochrome c family protein
MSDAHPSPRAAAFCAAAALALPLAVPEAPYERELARAGAPIFKTYCVSCHGADGRGDGELSGRLRYLPADLTRIAHRNKGKFPFDDVRRVVDGREPTKGHDRRDMPAWGDALKNPSEGYDERETKAKIEALVHYIASLQQEEKP